MFPKTYFPQAFFPGSFFPPVVSSAGPTISISATVFLLSRKAVTLGLPSKKDNTVELASKHSREVSL